MISVDEKVVEVEENENGHHRGLHIVVINHFSGEVIWAKCFDTYKSSERMEAAIKTIPKTSIIAAACQDDCASTMSKTIKEWFASMGSTEIWNIKFRHSFAFIGVLGLQEPHEKAPVHIKVPMYVA